LESGGHVVRNSQFFDTLKIQPSLPVEDIKARAEAQEINLRYFPDGDVIDSLIEILIEMKLTIFFVRLASLLMKLFARKTLMIFSAFLMSMLQLSK
jgi:hypothetical protein